MFSVRLETVLLGERACPRPRRLGLSLTLQTPLPPGSHRCPVNLAGCGGQVTGVSTRRGQLVELARVITASPALLTREQQTLARLTDSLAQLIAEDTGGASGAVEPWMAANAHMGVHRGLVAHVRRLILAGARDDALAAAIRAEADRDLGLVEHGPDRVLGLLG
jgi:hypothetical protein